MPIPARWRPLKTLPERRGRDALPGIYELADSEKCLIYIGQSERDVPNRIRQHLANSPCLQRRACYWRYAYSRVPQADEAVQLALYRKRHHALPLCNRAEPLERGAQRRYRERSRSS